MSAVLIVAAGRGTRAGSAVPKQYLTLGGQTILARTLALFLAMKEITRITVVIAPGDQRAYETALDGLKDGRLTAPVEGGATRAASVRAGLEAMALDPPETVLIHDAARPFAEKAAIRGVLEVLKVHDGAFLAVPVVDALWRIDGGFAISPQDRATLWRAQTPQGLDRKSVV